MKPISQNPYAIYEWQAGNSIFRAAPENGARLMSWQQGDRSVIHWPEEGDSKPIAKVRGGNPILFPFSARSYIDGQIGFWKDAAGTVRKIPTHGFARQGSFAIQSIDESGFSAEIIPDAETKNIYPYHYRFTVAYRFSVDSIECDLSLENQDKEPIPWSAGHHFYFSLPWLPDTTRANYQVTIPAEKACYHGADGALEPTHFSNPTPFSEDPLSDRIHYQLREPSIECRNDSDGSKIVIDYLSPLHPENALVTWTEAADSPFYCIEPWMGPPNSAETTVGLHWVKPGEIDTFSVRVTCLNH